MGAVVVLAVAAAKAGPSDTIWIAIVAATAAIASAWIARDVKKQGQRNGDALAAITHEVKNSHRTNLRDDLDVHGSKLDDVLTRLEQLGLSVGGLHEDVRILHRRDGLQASEVAELRAEIRRHADACSAGDRNQLG